jgi:hypothetical protein
MRCCGVLRVQVTMNNCRFNGFWRVLIVADKGTAHLTNCKVDLTTAHTYPSKNNADPVVSTLPPTYTLQLTSKAMGSPGKRSCLSPEPAGGDTWPRSSLQYIICKKTCAQATADDSCVADEGCYTIMSGRHGLWSQVYFLHLSYPDMERGDEGVIPSCMPHRSWVLVRART